MGLHRRHCSCHLVTFQKFLQPLAFARNCVSTLWHFRSSSSHSLSLSAIPYPALGLWKFMPWQIVPAPKQSTQAARNAFICWRFPLAFIYVCWVFMSVVVCVCAAHLCVVCGRHTNVFINGWSSVGNWPCFNGLGDTETNGTNRFNILWIWPHSLHFCLARRVKRSKHA